MNNLIKSNKAYYYLIPALFVILIFTIYPIFNSIFLSFHDIKGNLSLQTYQRVLADEKFHLAIKNTIMYALIVTPIGIITSLFISFFLTSKIKFKNTFQTIFFLPYVTSTIAIGTVWAYMYHTDYGIFNSILNALGFDSVGWLSNPDVFFISVMIFGIWKSLAFNILILFTAISGVDDSLEKAALIDGSTPMKTFFKIKLPQIYPVLTYLIIVGFIHSIKVYEEVVSLYTLTAGPDNSGITMVFYIYQQFQTLNKPEYASAAAVVLLIMTLTLTVLNKFLSKKLGGR